ncbi:MAG: hypothetical protein V7603_3387 [Micromonosporaceae bacterium]
MSDRREWFPSAGSGTLLPDLVSAQVIGYPGSGTMRPGRAGSGYGGAGEGRD